MPISQQSLNSRQRDVLFWVANGCPDGVWPDHTYKTVATALVSRRLITVSKRGGSWTATLLPAGQTYVDTGDYPEGHWRTKKRSQATTIRLPPSRPSLQPITSIEQLQPNRKTGGLTPGHQLVADIIAAGGLLERNTKGDKTNYGSLVGVINRRRMAPDSQRVISFRGRSYEDLVFKLVTVSDWKTPDPTDVLAARIGRWHPAVAYIRDYDRLSDIAKEHRRRAMGLLHCLAVEAQARGLSVRHVEKRAGNDYYSRREASRGLLVLSSGNFKCPFNLKQLQDRVPHVPTQREKDDAKRYSWNRIPEYDYVPSQRLSIIGLNAPGYPSEKSWPDTPTLSLEARLPDIMSAFEMWALTETEVNARREIELAERERIRERENEQARKAYEQEALGSRFVEDAAAWDRVNRLTAYLTSLREKADTIDDVDQQSLANEWIAWCERYLASENPLNRPIQRPSVKEPDSAEIAEYRRRLGFSTTWW